MISGTVAADLGQRNPMQHDKEALATVTGIVDGTGTIGAAIGQVHNIQESNTSSSTIFFSLFFLSFFSIFLSGPKHRHPVSIQQMYIGF